MTFDYKVLEVAPVDELTLEAAIAAWAPKGWQLDQVEFVRETGVRRPTMAYVFLRRAATTSAAEPPTDP